MKLDPLRSPTLRRKAFAGVALTGALFLIPTLLRGAGNREGEGSSWLWPKFLSSNSVPSPAINSAPASIDQYWTVESALERALLANPDVQVALANVQRQDGLRLQSRGNMFPRLGLSASTEKRAQGLIDRSPGELAFPPSQRTAISETHYDVRMELRQTVFDGLASWNQVKRSTLLQKKASFDAREQYLRVASTVRQSYDTISVRHAILATRREAVRDLSHLAEVARKRFLAGEISEYESLRALSVLRSAEAEEAQAESDLARSEEMFCRVLYIDRPASGLKVAAGLVPIEFNGTLEESLKQAQHRRLDLRSAELQLDAAKLAQRSVAAEFFPRLEAYVDYGYRSSYYDVHRRLDGWSIGIAGRWDIFKGGQAIGALRTQRADRQIAEIRVSEARRLIGSQVRELHAALDQARTLMTAHATARELGERSVKEARRLFEVGRISLEQVLNSELSYRQSLIGWLGAVYTFNSTVYQLDYATASETFLDRVAPGVR